MKKSLLNQIRQFFNKDVWDIPGDPAKPIKSFFIRSLSIVPFLAVAFGIAINFGFEKSLESNQNLWQR